MAGLGNDDTQHAVAGAQLSLGGRQVCCSLRHHTPHYTTGIYPDTRKVSSVVRSEGRYRGKEDHGKKEGGDEDEGDYGETEGRTEAIGGMRVTMGRGMKMDHVVMIEI